MCIDNQAKLAQNEEDALVMQQALKKEELKTMLEHIKEKLIKLEDEVSFRSMIRLQVGDGPMDSNESYMISQEIINVLDNEIDDLLIDLGKKISTLRNSQEISLKQSYKLEKQLGLLQAQYIDVGSYGNEL